MRKGRDRESPSQSEGLRGYRDEGNTADWHDVECKAVQMINERFPSALELLRPQRD
jgi:hypothetical protein